MYPTKQFSKASVAGAAVVIGKPDLGYDPAEINASFSVWCDGLDGGTFTVNIAPKAPVGAPFREHVSGAGANDTVVINGPVFNILQVTFSGLGVSAAPVVYMQGQRRH